MNPPFVHKPVTEKRTWLQRLFRRGRPDIAEEDFRNLLAEGGPEGLGHQVIADVARFNGLSARQLRKAAMGVYRTAFETFLSDDHVSDEESQYLSQLRAAFTLSDKELREVESSVAHPRYRKALAEILSDERIDAAERTRLDKLSGALRLDPKTEQAIRVPFVEKILKAKLDEIVEDRRISPLEDSQFQELSKALIATPEFDETTHRQLDLFRYYWQIENGQMPWIEVPIVLQKNEQCHYSSPARWYEVRTKTIAAGYSSVGYRIRIAKGLYYRAGVVKVSPIRQDLLTHIDSGTVYFTNKRIIFDGQKANKTIRLSSVLAVEPYADGLGIEKSSGRSPVITLSEHSELGNIVLSALLARNA